MAHSYHRYGPCSECGDLDGCHEWRSKETSPEKISEGAAAGVRGQPVAASIDDRDFVLPMTERTEHYSIGELEGRTRIVISERCRGVLQSDSVCFGQSVGPGDLICLYLEDYYGDGLWRRRWGSTVYGIDGMEKARSLAKGKAAMEILLRGRSGTVSQRSEVYRCEHCGEEALKEDWGPGRVRCPCLKLARSASEATEP